MVDATLLIHIIVEIFDPLFRLSLCSRLVAIYWIDLCTRAFYWKIHRRVPDPLYVYMFVADPLQKEAN